MTMKLTPPSWAVQEALDFFSGSDEAPDNYKLLDYAWHLVTKEEG